MQALRPPSLSPRPLSLSLAAPSPPARLSPLPLPPPHLPNLPRSLVGCRDARDAVVSAGVGSANVDAFPRLQPRPSGRARGLAPPPYPPREDRGERGGGWGRRHFCGTPSSAARRNPCGTLWHPSPCGAPPQGLPPDSPSSHPSLPPPTVRTAYAPLEGLPRRLLREQEDVLAGGAWPGPPVGRRAWLAGQCGQALEGEQCQACPPPNTAAHGRRARPGPYPLIQPHMAGRRARPAHPPLIQPHGRRARPGPALRPPRATTR